MVQKLKKFKHLNVLLILLFIPMWRAMLVVSDYFTASLTTTTSKQFDLHFYVFLAVFLAAIGLLMVLSYTLHELGHLIFGLMAGFKFKAFNVLCFEIVRKDEMLVLRLKKNALEVGGQCEMKMEEYREYNTTKVKLYFLGGIMMNIALVAISAIIAILSNNIYVKSFAIITLSINSYLALHNALPLVTKSGAETDMFKVVQVGKDSYYINKIVKVQRIIEMVEFGKSLKDIEIGAPTEFKTTADVMLGLLHVDGKIAKEEFWQAIEYINNMKTEARDLLFGQYKKVLEEQRRICLCLK